MQMDGTYTTYTDYIQRAKVNFINTCEKFYELSYTLSEILVRDFYQLPFELD